MKFKLLTYKFLCQTQRYRSVLVSISKTNLYLLKCTVFALGVLISLSSFSPKKEVKWLSFQALETALKKQPKKVIIHFYADWCVYCKKMETSVYTKPEIINQLEAKYHAVRFNVESIDTIQFGGKQFVNSQLGKKRTAFHDIPLLLASRLNQNLELPATIILDKEFNIIERYYRYIPPKEMLSILKD